MFKFNNGDKVKDQISGFGGVVVCRQQWFNGCVRYTVQPQGKKLDEMPEAKVFDEAELKLVKAQQVPSETASPAKKAFTGGPAGCRTAPLRTRA